MHRIEVLLLTFVSDRTGNELFGVVLCGNTHEFGMKLYLGQYTLRTRVPFHSDKANIVPHLYSDIDGTCKMPLQYFIPIL